MLLKKIKKFLLGLVATATVSATLVGSIGAVNVHADTANAGDLQLDTKAAIAVDAKSGQIIYGKNENQALPIASMSKLISIYLVLQAIKQGKLSWDKKVPVDDTSYAVSQNTTLSNVPLKKENTYTVRQLYQASLIYSANGAVMTLANAVSGSQVAFVDKMRALLKSWGIKDAEIYTVSGLGNNEIGNGKYPNAPENAENKMSAKSMALVSQKLLADYPEILKTTSIARMKFNNGTSETEMENWNWMLKGLAKAYSDLPVDGLKTGTSDSAGADFTATVNKNGRRIITVVLGAPHNGDTDLSRFVQTQKLMSYVYNNFTYTTLKAHESFKNANQLPVYHGKKLKVKAVTKNATNVWLKKDLSTSNLKATLTGNKKLYKNGGIEAPLNKNKKIGTISLQTKQQPLTYLNGDTALKLTATNTKKIEKANIFVIMGRAVKEFFTDLF
ncbi:serine hydrolase [Liquorilactobacillus oeni]|uniref:serine-type D-Ala-D-Ala carboxypeptidase n=1 Tax=Liquorilactobacillus oeni DSM 19972 TaxID=1423777 RepID=A0A0R1MBH8_9LACO|nr:serine hydrolase [Liquorilactobacillus oeni]KRL05420.1 D-alanyl-d-alanine carboxypeptidase [Liquorilactobacillus oeni DSM 19972]